MITAPELSCVPSGWNQNHFFHLPLSVNEYLESVTVSPAIGPGKVIALNTAGASDSGLSFSEKSPDAGANWELPTSTGGFDTGAALLAATPTVGTAALVGSAPDAP